MGTCGLTLSRWPLAPPGGCCAPPRGAGRAGVPRRTAQMGQESCSSEGVPTDDQDRTTTDHEATGAAHVTHGPSPGGSRAPLAALEVTSRILKRAQYEAFSFTLTAEGVRVRNNSHADPSEHEYLVTVADGVPTSCTCPADAYSEGACKHRAAVAIRAPVTDALDAAGPTEED